MTKQTQIKGRNPDATEPHDDNCQCSYCVPIINDPTLADRELLRQQSKLMNQNAMNEADRRERLWNKQHADAISHAQRHGFTPEPWATMYANHWIGSIEDFEKAVRRSMNGKPDSFRDLEQIVQIAITGAPYMKEAIRIAVNQAYELGLSKGYQIAQMIQTPN